MRKLLLSFAAVAALMATPAYADGDLFVEVDVEKDVQVREVIAYDVDVRAEFDVTSAPEKFAESLVFSNQRNEFNAACGNCAEKQSVITDAGNANDGTVSINQATGNMNSQGTIVSAAVDVDVPSVPPPPPGLTPVGGFAHAQAAAEQVNRENEVETVNLLFRDAIIDASLNGNTGNTFANQASGNINNQLNVVSLAFSAETYGVALADAALGQESVFNSVAEGRNEGDPTTLGIVKDAELTASMNGNFGVIAVNQSAGNGGNQANMISLAVLSTGGVPTLAR